MRFPTHPVLLHSFCCGPPGCTGILNNNPIAISSLAPGTYTVLIWAAKGEHAMAKWVKP
jgi:hypothetical protein